MPDSNHILSGILPSTQRISSITNQQEEANTRSPVSDDKSTVSGGMQIALHDGTQMLIKVAHPKNPSPSYILRFPTS